ncbi:hypothetical protein I4U23_007124 [Adineta vaga]|nr:hypothetical protein I4U23_007124 [Adineta vaga]
MNAEDIFYIIIGIIFIFLLLITAFFSSTISIIIVIHWRLRCKSISNFLTVNSCIGYLLFVVSSAFHIPFLFQNNEQAENDSFSTWCRFRGCFFLVGCVVKTLSYFVQGISRYFITVLYKHRQLLTYRINATMVCFNWIVGVFIGCSMLISPVAFQYEHESRMCVLSSKTFHTSFALMVAAFVIPINTIVILYGLILRHSTHANRIQLNAANRGNNKRNIKVFQNILMILGVVIVGGTPYLSSILINKFSAVPWPLYSISILFIALAAAVESVIIFFTNTEVKAIFCAKIGIRQTEITRVKTFIVTAKVIPGHSNLNNAGMNA